MPRANPTTVQESTASRPRAFRAEMNFWNEGRIRSSRDFAVPTSDRISISAVRLLPIPRRIVYSASR